METVFEKLTSNEICVLQASLFYMMHVDGMTKKAELILDRLYRKSNEERGSLGNYEFKVWEDGITKTKVRL